MTDNYTAAAAHVAAADHARARLLQVYAAPVDPAPHVPAALHQRISFALKRAEVAALLAIAERLEDLVEAIDPEAGPIPAWPANHPADGECVHPIVNTDGRCAECRRVASGAGDDL